MRLLFHCLALALAAATAYDSFRCVKLHHGAHLPLMVITAVIVIAWCEAVAFAPWKTHR